MKRLIPYLSAAVLASYLLAGCGHSQAASQTPQQRKSQQADEAQAQQEMQQKAQQANH